MELKFQIKIITIHWCSLSTEEDKWELLGILLNSGLPTSLPEVAHFPRISKAWWVPSLLFFWWWQLESFFAVLIPTLMMVLRRYNRTSVCQMGKFLVQALFWGAFRTHFFISHISDWRRQKISRPKSLVVRYLFPARESHALAWLWGMRMPSVGVRCKCEMQCRFAVVVIFVCLFVFTVRALSAGFGGRLPRYCPQLCPAVASQV